MRGTYRASNGYRDDDNVDVGSCANDCIGSAPVEITVVNGSRTSSPEKHFRIFGALHEFL